LKEIVKYFVNVIFFGFVARLSIAIHTGILNIARAWWRCYHVTLGFALLSRLTSSGNGLLASATSLGSRPSCLASFTGILDPFLAVHIIKRLGLAPANAKRAALDNGFTLTFRGSGLGVRAIDIVDKSTV
jgi:hypothetical protein